MSFSFRIEPLSAWPLPPTRPRKAATFRATYNETLKLLSRELEHLDARGAVAIQVVTRDGAADVRKDGALYARAQITHPGVRVSFESKHGPLTYATDTFETRWAHQMPEWQANLRAIALGLESLRAVDRYGISRSGEQYRGWRAIESAGSEAPVTVLIRWAGPHFAEKYQSDLPNLARAARAGAHPDRHGGDHAPTKEVLAAMRALGLDA